MLSHLESLKKCTTVVADTGDIESIIAYKPEDSTTNPSLILAAAKMVKYQSLLEEAISWAKDQDQSSWVELALDRLAINFGVQLLKYVPGRVSTEVDASLSFDTAETIKTARRIIAMYADEGIQKDRILIKIAATWEGIKAAEILEKEHIQCNLTLIFSEVQAIACAEAGVHLISPFVGRILDWHALKTGTTYSASEDPGVLSVTRIYNYFKQHGYKTIVMGASFRNVGEIIELAGCDRLTISPALLEELSELQGELVPRLSEINALSNRIEKIDIRESNFRWLMNQDEMATEKLGEGIRKFNSDLNELRKYVGRF